MQDAAAEGLRLYCDPDCTALREAAAGKHGVNPGQVFCGNGSDEVLAFAFAAFFAGNAPDRPALFPDVSYSFYPVWANLWNVQYKTVPVGGDFSVSPADYNQPNGGIVIANPNAPTSLALSCEAVEEITEYAAARGSVIIVDEAYIDFAPGECSVVPLINKYDNLLVVRTLSKSASLAGLRVGYCMGCENLIAALKAVRDSFNSYTVDAVSQAGARAALLDTAYFQRVTEHVSATRSAAIATLCSIGCEVLPSAANFVLTRFPGLSGAEAFARLREKGILVRHFDKPRTRDWLRVTLGTDADMEEFYHAANEAVGH
jgi:histidinol-phosphate aminotransferase